MNCTHCGFAIGAGQTACPACGSAVAAASAQPVAPQPVAPGAGFGQPEPQGYGQPAPQSYSQPVHQGYGQPAGTQPYQPAQPAQPAYAPAPMPQPVFVPTPTYMQVSKTLQRRNAYVAPQRILPTKRNYMGVEENQLLLDAPGFKAADVPSTRLAGVFLRIAGIINFIYGILFLFFSFFVFIVAIDMSVMDEILVLESWVLFVVILAMGAFYLAGGIQQNSVASGCKRGYSLRFKLLFSAVVLLGLNGYFVISALTAQYFAEVSFILWFFGIPLALTLLGSVLALIPSLGYKKVRGITRVTPQIAGGGLGGAPEFYARVENYVPAEF